MVEKFKKEEELSKKREEELSKKRQEELSKKKEEELRTKKEEELRKKETEEESMFVQSGGKFMKALKPLPDGQISTIYLGQTSYKDSAGRDKTVDILTRFILEPQSNRLFGDSLIDYGKSIERSVIKITKVRSNEISYREIWGKESRGEYVSATYYTEDSWESFSGKYYIPGEISPGFTDGKRVKGKNVIKMYLDKKLSDARKSGCTTKKNMKGYKDFKLCMGVSQVIAKDICEEFREPKNVDSIGGAYSLAKIEFGEVVFGKRCYEIMGKKRDIAFYFIDNKLSSIGVTLSYTGAGQEGKQVYGEFDFEKFFISQNSLEKKYGLNFDPGKMKITVFLNDLQKTGRINTIYGDGTVVLSILRWRLQDYEPIDEVNVFYNSKSVADSILGTQSKKELKDDDL